MPESGTTPKYPGAVVTDADLGGPYDNFGKLTLDGDHTSGIGTITVVEVVPVLWPQRMWLTIENEIVLVTSWTGKVFTVTRAQQGTSAAAHANLTRVGRYLTEEAFNQLAEEIKAIQNQWGAVQDLGTISSATPTINWALGAHAEFILAVNITTLTLSNPLNARFHVMKIKQDGTGGRTIAWPGSVDWGAPGAPPLGTANQVAIVVLLWDSSSAKYYGSWTVGYAS